MRIVWVVLFTTEGPLFVNLEHPLLPDPRYRGQFLIARSRSHLFPFIGPET